jgi:hypothetical protein
MNADHRKENFRKIKEMVRSATPSARRSNYLKWFLPIKKQLNLQIRHAISSELWCLRRWIRENKKETVLLSLKRLRELKLNAQAALSGSKGGRPIDPETNDIIKRVLRYQSGDNNLNQTEIYQAVANEFDKTSSAVEKAFQRYRKKLPDIRGDK